MSNVVTIEPDRIEPVAAIRSTIATNLISGIIKDQADGSMVMILDVRVIVPFEAATAAPAAAQSPSATAAVQAAAELQLVSFMVAGQEYALPIEQVAEIVQVPPAITGVPNTGTHVVGVMTLRDRLLPLVSLRRIMNLGSAAMTDANKIVVVALPHGRWAGLVMDSVREVLRVSAATIDPLPPIVSHASQSSEVVSICRLENGTRLVSILAVERLFAGTDHDAGAGPGVERGDAAAAAAMSEAGDDEEQFVVFRVMGEEYAVPIASVHEIVRVPEELVRVPQTPDFIEGIVNLRGAILPIFDQRRRFGLPQAERNERQRIIVFSVGAVRTGFIVDSITQVIRVPVSAIGPAPQLAAEQRRLIRRVANLAQARRMLLLLDVEALLDVQELDALAAAAA
jgi:purine-binding chemotaxis protein CheW